MRAKWSWFAVMAVAALVVGLSGCKACCLSSRASAPEAAAEQPAVVEQAVEAKAAVEAPAEAPAAEQPAK